ncbi:MAG: DUF488 domain-containing protein [Thermoproteota archaeon]|nr:DUF488 domain-containing protein [Thermoproteota archaeon]
MIFTIGHSNRSWTEFLSIIQHYNISVLVDIRRFPGSRLWPQFNKGYMEKELGNHKIKYFHIEKLGGRRKVKRSDSNFPFKNEENAYNNHAWTNSSFRSYADYMSTPEFMDGIDELLSLNVQEKKYNHCNMAIMCAEALPWRCHRRLISDYLVAIMDVEVYDIIDISHKSPHKLTSFAYIKDGRVTYPSKNG